MGHNSTALSSTLSFSHTTQCSKLITQHSRLRERYFLQPRNDFHLQHYLRSRWLCLIAIRDVNYPAGRCVPAAILVHFMQARLRMMHHLQRLLLVWSWLMQNLRAPIWAGGIGRWKNVSFSHSFFMYGGPSTTSFSGTLSKLCNMSAAPWAGSLATWKHVFFAFSLYSAI